MPIIQERLTKFFGVLPSKGVHPDEAVAIGAALYAHSLEDDTNLAPAAGRPPWPSGWRRGRGAHVVPPERRHPQRQLQIQATTSFDGQTELRCASTRGHEAAKKNERCSGSSLLRHQRWQGGRGPGRGDVRRERRGHPHHERARPRHRTEDEDHRRGDAEPNRRG